jgi:hypothetical protein
LFIFQNPDPAYIKTKEKHSKNVNKIYEATKNSYFCLCTFLSNRQQPAARTVILTQVKLRHGISFDLLAVKN